MATALLLFALALVAIPANAMPATPAIVHGDATLRGILRKSAGLTGPVRDYAAFLGIPFAKAPTGDLRFKAPVPVPLPENGTLRYDVVTPVCLQQLRIPTPSVIGDEDCLTLQIFTPNYDTPTLPVMVNIHGGGFMYGGGPRTGMEYLIDQDIVIVSVSYRLGVLGFLSFEDREMPGNLGLLDQLEALKWVQKYIHLFGGDNKSVTLVGNSAGSASCYYHTISPLSQGLFHKVIGTSGSPLNPWALQQGARQDALHLAEVMNCTAPRTTDMVTCLQGKNGRDVVAAQMEYFQDWLKNPFAPFSPVVDSKAEKPFLPIHPRTILQSGKGVADVPMVMSANTDEGIYTTGEFIVKNDTLNALDQSWETDAPRLLNFHHNHVSSSRKLQMAHQIRKQYMGDSSIVNGRSQLIQMVGDRNFASGVSEHARTIAAHIKSPVYFWRFGYRGQYSLSYFESGDNSDMGVSHADDFQYLMDVAWAGPLTRPEDIEMRKDFIHMFTSFIKTSVPVFPNTRWTPVKKYDYGLAMDYLMVSSPTQKQMVRDPDFAHAHFWKTINNAGHSSASLILSLVSVGIVAISSLMSGR